MKNIFIQGPIPPEKISRSVEAHQSKTDIGAHYIFLGQVRADEIDGQIVEAIEYTAQEELANKLAHEIREEAFEKYDISCLHVYHSLGRIRTGEICFFVFVSGAHRNAPREALNFLVESIKEKLPVFGKEIFQSGQYQWKKNR